MIVPKGAFPVYGLAALALCMPAPALAQQRSFDVPSQPANRAILLFAQQAGIQIVAPGSRLRHLRTKPIKGRFDIRTALQTMLEGTGIRIVSEGNNTITLGIDTASQSAAASKATEPEDSRRRPAQPSVNARPPPGGVSSLPPPGPMPTTTMVIGEVLVTGSRIRKDGYDSPVPLTVVDASLIAHLGQTSAPEIMRLIPQNIATQSDATAGNGFSTDIGAAFANLRGLNPTFGTRTLVLVNSRRFVPTSDGGQVDLNFIPSIMIERVETVTGGASAAYGSDAVAGVVNFVLDDKLEGIKTQLDYGLTGRGDGQSVHAAAAFGQTLGGGRGHVIVGGEYQHNRGIAECAGARDWCAQSWGVFVNAAGIQPGTRNIPANVSGYDVPGSFGYGHPNFVIGPSSGLIYNSAFGAIRNFTAPARDSTTTFSNIYPAIDPPLAAVDKVFTADGTAVVDYDPGVFGPKSVGGQAQGGDNLSAYSDQNIQTPSERFSIYAAADYALSDTLALSAEATYAQRRSAASSIVSATRSTMAIKADNAFLPTAVAASLNGAAFSLGKDVDEELDNSRRVDAQVFRGVIGLSGGLFADWTWDGYYQFGINTRHSRSNYARQNDAFVMALDAVRDPNDPGRIICRPLSPTVLAGFTPAYQAELQNLYARCVPINVFGIGNMSQAAIDFVWHKVGENFIYRQHAYAASAQGTLSAGLGAGPISLAAGIEHRDETGDITHGGINPNAYAGAFGLDYAGKIAVTEGFVETDMPVFKDSALGKLLALNGAVRYTRNRSTDTLTGQSRTVDAVSWKIGAIHDLTGGLRLRATHSRDIRAAGLRELFQKTAPTDEGTVQGRVDNPNIPGPNKVDNTPIFTGGNFSLTPEKANTTTIGAVFAPAFLSNVKLSLDWYQIKVKDAIANLNGQRVTDLCVSYDVLCNRITFASPTNIVRIDAGQANVGQIAIRGFDFEASYRLALSDIASAMRGVLDTRLLLNRQYDFIVKQNPAVPAINYAGQSGPAIEGGDFYPTPKWIWNALVAYDTDRFNATVTVRHVGKGILNRDWIGPDDPSYVPTLPNSVNINHVPSRTYVSLAMSYDIPVGDEGGKKLQIFGTLENLFDTRPPVAPGGTTTVLVSAYPTNPVFFDTFGMRWRAGARISF